MDIRLQNALITKYADLKAEQVDSGARDGITEAGMENIRAQSALTAGRTLKDVAQAKAKTVAADTTEKRRQAILDKDFARITAQQDAAKATRIKGEEAAASAKTKGEEAAASAKTKGEEAAGRASLRGYLNPTTSSTGNMALYGGGGALLGGGLAALLSSPKNRKRNALMYALLGGGLGIGAKMLGDRYAAEPAGPGPGFLESILPSMRMPPGGTVGY